MAQIRGSSKVRRRIVANQGDHTGLYHRRSARRRVRRSRVWAASKLRVGRYRQLVAPPLHWHQAGEFGAGEPCSNARGDVFRFTAPQLTRGPRTATAATSRAPKTAVMG